MLQPELSSSPPFAEGNPNADFLAEAAYHFSLPEFHYFTDTLTC